MGPNQTRNIGNCRAVLDTTFSEQRPTIPMNQASQGYTRMAFPHSRKVGTKLEFHTRIKINIGQAVFLPKRTSIQLKIVLRFIFLIAMKYIDTFPFSRGRCTRQGHRHRHKVPRTRGVQARVQKRTAHAGKDAVTPTLVKRPNTQRNKT